MQKLSPAPQVERNHNNQALEVPCVNSGGFPTQKGHETNPSCRPLTATRASPDNGNEQDECVRFFAGRRCSSPASGFPQGADPAEFSVGAGSITASGGSAETRGELGLYADDLFAWDFLAGSDGLITFNDLDVTAIDGYWVHPNRQAAGATMTVMFSGGGSAMVASAPVNATGLASQPIGFFATVTAPEGESITSLVFSSDEGAADGDVAALDVLELSVR